METVNSSGGRLAVVIPAWRSRHFAAALGSLRAQTDLRFRVYVGDDASPDDLRLIAAEAARDLDLVYHRFPSNLGSSDLIAHWHRCIALSQDEPWIWLFSDDDLADPGCVAAFHRHLDSGDDPARLLRFDLAVIDDAGAVIETPEAHPDHETAPALMAATLSENRRKWRAPDHIFARSVYREAGGFVPLPKALCADTATWIRFSRPGGVRQLRGPLLRWRHHPAGLSSGQFAANRSAWLAAIAGYCSWCREELRHYPPESRATLTPLITAFHRRILHRLNPPLAWAELPVVAAQAGPAVGGRARGWLIAAWLTLRVNARRLPGLHALARRRVRPRA
jgi:hypothetical protein